MFPMPADSDALREYVAQFLRKNFLTKSQFAARAGIGRETLRSYMGSLHDIQLANFIKICKAMGLDVKVVSDGSTAPPPTSLQDEMPARNTWLDDERWQLKRERLDDEDEDEDED